MEVYLGLGINGSLLHVFGLIQQGNVELGYVGLSFVAVGFVAGCQNGHGRSIFFSDFKRPLKSYQNGVQVN